MIEPELPATQPIPTIDPTEALEFLARLRLHTRQMDRAMRISDED